MSMCDTTMAVAPESVVSPPVWMVLAALFVPAVSVSLCDAVPEVSASCSPDPGLSATRSVSSSSTTCGMTTELSTATVGLVSSPFGLFADADVSESSAPLFAESAEEFSVGVFSVGVVTDDPPGLVADGSEPTVVTGLVPEVVGPEELLDGPESVPVADEELVDPSDEVVDPGGEFVDSADEFVDSDELEDDWRESSGAADAAPMPPVQTSPATPSEKATAPTRNAYFSEFTGTPRLALSVAQVQVEESVVALSAIPKRVSVVVVRDLNLRPSA